MKDKGQYLSSKKLKAIEHTFAIEDPAFLDVYCCRRRRFRHVTLIPGVSGTMSSQSMLAPVMPVGVTKRFPNQSRSCMVWLNMCRRIKISV